jgi:hypothetical protein
MVRVRGRRHSLRRNPSLIVALSVIAACNRTPTAPGPVSTPPTASLVTGLEVTGPSSLPPGMTAQFTATAIHADGSHEDVTTRATWTILLSTATNVLSISQTGVATLRKNGQASVGTAFAGLSGISSGIDPPTGWTQLFQ